MSTATVGRAPPVKRNIASLVGGIAIAIGCLILWLMIAFMVAGGAPGWGVIVGGIVFAIVIGGWVRLADL